MAGGSGLSHYSLAVLEPVDIPVDFEKKYYVHCLASLSIVALAVDFGSDLLHCSTSKGREIWMLKGNRRGRLQSRNPE